MADADGDMLIVPQQGKKLTAGVIMRHYASVVGEGKGAELQTR